MNRFFALTNFFLQMTNHFIPIKQVIKGATDSFRKSEAKMIKDVINETTASIELKLNKVYFKMALGLAMISVLAYGVIRLIWYFENYLMLNYGESYAILLLAVIVAAIALQMIFAKYAMDKVSREKRTQLLEKSPNESEAQSDNPGFFAAPEKLLHQAFLGFIDGFTKSPRETETLQLPAGESTADRGKDLGREYQQGLQALNLDHLRSASH